MTSIDTDTSTTTTGGGGRVVVVGSLNVDLFAQVRQHPRPGETILGEAGGTRPGGKGANQALAAALAGAPTVMVGCVGDDAHAQIATGLLREAGVDTSRIRTVTDTPTGMALIAVADGGENTIIVLPGANGEVTQADIDAVDLSGDDVVVVQGEIPLNIDDAVAQRCADTGARLVVNLAPVVHLSAATLRAADPLVVNEHEARAAADILGVETSETAETPDLPPSPESPGREDGPSMAVEAATALAEDIVGAGVASVVITLGPAGAVVAARDEASRHCGGERVSVVDTTGAGDCFVGTLAARLATGASLREATTAGNAAAAVAVQHSGAQESYRPRPESQR